MTMNSGGLMKRTGIFGLGLLGASAALCLKQVDPSSYVRAYVRDTGRAADALKLGIADQIFSMVDVDLSDIGLIIIAAPVSASLDIISRVLNHSTLNPDALVMDVGSVKQTIVDTALKTKNAAKFVGCHPMAGSEKSGYQHAYASLYKNSHVLITPSSANSPDILKQAEEFWTLMGARCFTVTPDQHDKIVAYTSHLPHFAASAITAVVKSRTEKGVVPGVELIRSFIGNGFRDTTRISEGSSAMWVDIAEQNRDNITESIDILIEELHRMKSLIAGTVNEDCRLSENLEEIKKFRAQIK